MVSEQPAGANSNRSVNIDSCSLGLASAHDSDRQRSLIVESHFTEQKSVAFDSSKTRAGRYQRGYAGVQRLAVSVGKYREHLTSELYRF
jgi:hypothetical protein